MAAIVRRYNPEVELHFPELLANGTSVIKLRGQASLSADYDVQLPAASGILGSLGASQTWAGANQYNGASNFVGLATFGLYTVVHRTGVNGTGAINTPIAVWKSDGKTIGDGGIISWNALNSADAEIAYSQIIMEIVDPTAASEDGKLKLRTVRGGTMTDQLVIDNIGRATLGGPINTAGYTVATLPGATIGDRTYVTDALGPVHLAAVVGGGAVVCPVFYNGAAWIVA